MRLRVLEVRVMTPDKRSLLATSCRCIQPLCVSILPRESLWREAYFGDSRVSQAPELSAVKVVRIDVVIVRLTSEPMPTRGLATFYMLEWPAEGLTLAAQTLMWHVPARSMPGCRRSPGGSPASTAVSCSNMVSSFTICY